jgi:probable HAF family extracellular repeat protein
VTPEARQFRCGAPVTTTVAHAVVVVGVLLVASAAAAQSVSSLTLTPAVVPPAAAGPVLIEAQVSGAPTSVTVDFGPAGTATTVITLHDDGSGGDKVAADHIFTAQLPVAPILAARTADDVNRVFIGYLNLFNGATRVFRGNLFVDVYSPDVGSYPIASLSPFVQATARVVNIHAPTYFSTLDLTQITQEFYQWFGDDYDVLNIVFVPQRFQNRTHFVVRNDVQGIGIPVTDNSALYGSAGRLQGISQFPVASFFDGAEVGVLHELGHQWINFLNVPPFAAGVPHWPISSMASGIMGFSIGGQGGQGGEFPCSIVESNGHIFLNPRPGAPVYNDLDLYLMGLLPAAQVSSQIVFADQAAAGQLQCTGQEFTGQVLHVDADDVIASFGPRIPAAGAAPTSFRLATILVTRDGLATPEMMSLYSWMAERAELQVPVATHLGFLKRVDQPFYLATGGRATLDTTIDFGLSADSVTPASGSGPSQIFSAQYSVAPGATNLLLVQLRFATGVSGTTDTCMVRYDRAADLIALRDDAGVWQSGAAPGSAVVQQNTQCAIDIGASSVAINGDTLTFNAAMSFRAVYAGAKNVYLNARSVIGATTGWVLRGTWTVTTPTVAAVSATPNAGSGVAQLFTLTYSDSAGVAADLSGAMVRFTNDANPALMCAIHHRATTGQVRIMDDVGVWGPWTSYGSGTLSNSQCSLDLATSSATPNGNDLTLALRITFLPAFAGPATISMRAQSVSGANTGWLSRGTWTAGALIDAISITPSSGIGVTRTFDAAFTDSLGVSADLKRAMVRFGASTVNGCVVDYNAITATVRLFDDAGVPGTPAAFGSGSLTNSQCTLDLSQSSAAPSGTNLTLTLRLIFKAPLLGPQPIFMRATSNYGNDTGWAARGTWDVNAIVNAIAVTPNNGAGPTQTFLLTFSDSEGVAADLAAARVRLRSPDGQQCGISYNAMTDLVRVQDDAGEFGPFTPFGLGAINNNSQCILDLSQSSAARSGTDLMMTLHIIFKPTFVGPTTIDMRANSNVGSTTGWQQRGTWTLPGIVSVSPSSGTGLSQTFTMHYWGPFGAPGLTEAEVRIAGYPFDFGTCSAKFKTDDGTIALLNDAGTSWQSGTFGSGTLANSQCTLNLAASEATVTGNDLALALNITFGSNFMGPKNIFMRAAVTGQFIGWYLKGTWNLIPDSNSGPIDIGTLGGYASEAVALNNSGQIVGNSRTSDTELHGFSWTPATGMVDMGDFGGSGSSVTRTNEVGQSVGGGGLYTGGTHPFLWTQAGGMIDLGTVVGDGGGSAFDVNVNGWVVGYSWHAIGPIPPTFFSHPFLWTPANGMVDLGTLGGRQGRAVAVNASGQVVGGSDTDLSFSGQQHAFLWTQADGMFDLGTLGGDLSSVAIGVNDDGLIVGNSGTLCDRIEPCDPANSVPHAFVWTPSSGMVPLGTFGGVKSRVRALSANGHVVGDSQNGAGKYHAFMWTASNGMVDLGTLGGNESSAVAVNASGQVVGWSDLADGSRHAFWWTQTLGMVDLGTLGGNSSAAAINDRCQVVGSSIAPNGQTHATLWNIASCVAPGAAKSR